MPYTHVLGASRDAEILHLRVIGGRRVEHIIEVGRSEI